MSYKRAAPQQCALPRTSDAAAPEATSSPEHSGADGPASDVDFVSSLETLGGFLFELYQAACRLPLEQFQALAIDRLRAVLPFDSAWWGLATQVDEGIYVYFSYQYGLPENCSEIINSSGGDNVVARSCAPNVGVTFNFRPAELYRDVATGFPAQILGIQHLLCTQMLDRPPGKWNVVALMRQDASRPFGERERQLKEQLMPHLNQMLNINRFAHLSELRSKADVPPGFAGIVDTHDIVHTFDPGFEAMLRQEWPDWDGILLPQPVQVARRQGKEHLVGRRLIVHFGSADGQSLVVLTRRSKLDLLSPREQVIAKEFAEGSSYKEVARKLDASPATVRNHLQSIYQKLGISSKAELSRLHASRS